MKHEEHIFDLNNPTAAPVDKDACPIKTWSASSLKTFEQCPLKLYFAKVDKHPDPSGPAADRGTMLHDEAEHYVDGTSGELHPELLKYEKEFDWLREQYADGKVICEQDWGFTKDWEPTGWTAPDVWGRMKLDALLLESDTSAIVIDYKSGRKRGNEIAHGAQAMIYQLGTFMRYPKLEFIQTQFWYIDQGVEETMTKNYTRAELPIFKKGIEARANRLTDCSVFPAKPSPQNCKWCNFGKEGICKWSAI